MSKIFRPLPASHVHICVYMCAHAPVCVSVIIQAIIGRFVTLNYYSNEKKFCISSYKNSQYDIVIREAIFIVNVVMLVTMIVYVIATIAVLQCDKKTTIK